MPRKERRFRQRTEGDCAQLLAERWRRRRRSDRRGKEKERDPLIMNGPRELSAYRDEYKSGRMEETVGKKSIRLKLGCLALCRIRKCRRMLRRNVPRLQILSEKLKSNPKMTSLPRRFPSPAFIIFIVIIYRDANQAGCRETAASGKEEKPTCRAERRGTRRPLFRAFLAL